MTLKTVDKRFKKWLRANGYTIVKGDYPGMFEAETLVDDFMDEYPELEDYGDLIAKAAKKAGYVSQWAWDGPDDTDYNARDLEDDEIDESRLYF